MTVRHHIGDDLLLSYAAGALDEASRSPPIWRCVRIVVRALPPPMRSAAKCSTRCPPRR